MSVCRENGIPTQPPIRVPSEHDIWVKIRWLKSGGKEVTDEELAKHIRMLWEGKE